MLVTRYKIERISESEENQTDRWRIDLEMEPTWFDRTFMGIIFTRKLTLEGSYMTWHWCDSDKVASVFWSIWADCAVKKHLKDHGKTYSKRSSR